MSSSKFCRALFWLVGVFSLPTMASAFSAMHVGNSNPTSEGFSPVTFVSPGGTASAVTNDLGVNSWQLGAPSTVTQFLYASGTFTPAEKLAITTEGFTVSFEARVLQGAATTIYSAATPYVIGAAGIDTGARRYQVFLGLDANGDTVVVLPSSINNNGVGNRVVAPGASFTLTGQGNGYHKYDLAFSSITQQASLYVDGALTASGYSGFNNILNNNGLSFSVFSAGVSRFSSVSLNISAVPEPTTESLFVLGLIALVYARRRNYMSRA